MKKIIAAILLAIAGTTGAYAIDIDPHYKGYVELGGGGIFYDEYFDSGSHFSVSTTHGIELFEGLFLGAGIQLAGLTYNDWDYRNRYEESEFGFMGVGYIEGRYSFLRTKKISPFVSYRVGGGYQTITEYGGFYTSPAVGCVFNFTDNFGLDVSLRYDYFGIRCDLEDFGYHYNGFDNYEIVGAHAIMATVGIHF